VVQCTKYKARNYEYHVCQKLFQTLEKSKKEKQFENYSPKLFEKVHKKNPIKGVISTS